MQHVKVKIIITINYVCNFIFLFQSKYLYNIIGVSPYFSTIKHYVN